MNCSGSASKQTLGPKMVLFLLQSQQNAWHSKLTTEISNHRKQVMNVN